MEYVKIAKVQDFDTVRIRSYRILARHVGVFKEPDGSFYAMQTACKHQNADLIGGRMDGDVVTCPWHGWKYDLRTGECLWGSEAKLLRHGLRIEGDDIYVSVSPIEEQEQVEEWERW